MANDWNDSSAFSLSIPPPKRGIKDLTLAAFEISGIPIVHFLRLSIVFYEISYAVLCIGNSPQ